MGTSCIFNSVHVMKLNPLFFLNAYFFRTMYPTFTITALHKIKRMAASVKEKKKRNGAKPLFVQQTVMGICDFNVISLIVEPQLHFISLVNLLRYLEYREDFSEWIPTFGKVSISNQRESIKPFPFVYEELRRKV